MLDSYIHYIHTCVAAVNPCCKASSSQSFCDVKYSILVRRMVTDKHVVWTSHVCITYNSTIYSNLCKRSSGWINYDNNVHITKPDTKNIPNCDVLFANGQLHQVTWRWRRAHDQNTVI